MFMLTFGCVNYCRSLKYVKIISRKALKPIQTVRQRQRRNLTAKRSHIKSFVLQPTNATAHQVCSAMGNEVKRLVRRLKARKMGCRKKRRANKQKVNPELCARDSCALLWHKLGVC